MQMQYNKKKKKTNILRTRPLLTLGLGLCRVYCMYVLCLVWIVDRGGEEGEERVTTPGKEETNSEWTRVKSQSD